MRKTSIPRKREKYMEEKTHFEIDNNCYSFFLDQL